jgi:hypothetical protein
MSLSSAERQRFVGLLKQMDTSIGALSIAQFVQDHRLDWDHLQSSHKRLASCLRMLDSNQVGERRNAGRLAAMYIKELALTYDDVIGADLPPEAEWEPEPEANWEPEPAPEPKQPKYEWPTYEKPIDLDEAAWEPQNEKGKPKRKTADEQAYEKAVDEARAARDVATSDELTVTQRVVVVVAKLAIAITLMFATKWFCKNALTPTQALVVSVLGLTGMSVWWIVKLIRWQNAKTALHHEKAWRRRYIEPHSINMG